MSRLYNVLEPVWNGRVHVTALEAHINAGSPPPPPRPPVGLALED